MLGPGDHGGGVEGSLVGGAVTGGFAAASAEVVDGTFDELTEGEQGNELTLVVIEQRLEGLTQAAGAIGWRGQKDGSPLYVIYNKNIKNARCFIEKNEDSGKYFWRRANGSCRLASERSTGTAEAP